MIQALAGPVSLSRLQFTATIMFHFIWPLTNRGLAGFLVAWLLTLRPGVLEPGLTPLTASAAPESLTILFWGTGIALPVITGYTTYQYRVFKGQRDYSSDEDH